MRQQHQTRLIDDKTNTIATQLVHRLREDIVSGASTPGAKINVALAREAWA